MYSLKTLLSSTGVGSVKCCICPTPLIYLMGVTTKKKYLASFAYLSITITPDWSSKLAIPFYTMNTFFLYEIKKKLMHENNKK